MTIRRFCAVVAIFFLASIFTPLRAVSQDWPGFRGPNYDGSAPAGASVSFEPGGGLNVKWRATLGAGYSAVSIAEGRAITMFSDGPNDVVASFDASTGKELWRHTLGPKYAGHDGSHDGPIATPLISGGRVFCLDAWGKMVALDSKSGQEIWKIDLAESVGDRKPYYGFGSSPLMADGILILQVGADSNRAIAGYDPATGKLKWSLGDDKVNYQSPILMKWKGKTQVLATGDKKLFGIHPAEGKILWEYDYQGEARAMANESLVPVPAGEGLLFLKNKQDSSTMVRLTEGDGGAMKVAPVWSAGVLKATYSLPVYHDGHLYGYNGRTVLTCVDAATGQMKWRSREPGDGFLLLVNGNLVVQTKEGSLHVAPASPSGWKETAKVDLFKAVAWANPSFADGAIFSRSQGEMARIEWTAGKAADATAVSVLGAVPAGSKLAKTVEQIGAAADKKAAVDQFLASIPSYPFVEWPDHVHFLFRGEAQDMGIAGDMIGERREDPMHRVPGTDLFTYSIRLAPDARINYRFIRNYEEILTDPMHNRKLKDQRGEYSWMAMPGWKEPDHLKEAAQARRGTVESKEIKPKAWEGSTAKFDVYLPAGYAQGKDRYPTVYIFGGPEARQQGLIQNTLDNLIGNSIRPVIAVFLAPVEFGPKPPEDYLKTFELSIDIYTKEIVPLVDASFRTIPEVSSRATMGAGFVGSDALYTVFKHPELFGNFAGQSVFILEEDEAILKKVTRTYAEQPVRMYFDWGLYDAHATREGWDLRRMLRNFNAFLQERGYMPAGGEVHDSSGWMSWRNRTDRWLTTLFPM